MSNEEILYRIHEDILKINNGMLGIRNLKVYMTTALYIRLLKYTNNVLTNGTQYTSLFGCRVKVFPGKELLWIVGYDGKAEDDES